MDDSPVRLSMVPDPLLVIALGPVDCASGWFTRGFFTKVGETLGQEVGDDLVAAYRDFKESVRSLVTERRRLPDQQPITMMTLLLHRPGGGQIRVEGSTRGDGVFAYALDDDAERSYIAITSDEQYKVLLARKPAPSPKF